MVQNTKMVWNTLTNTNGGYIGHTHIETQKVFSEICEVSRKRLRTFEKLFSGGLRVVGEGLGRSRRHCSDREAKGPELEGEGEVDTCTAEGR